MKEEERGADLLCQFGHALLFLTSRHLLPDWTGLSPVKAKHRFFPIFHPAATLWIGGKSGRKEVIRETTRVRVSLVCLGSPRCQSQPRHFCFRRYWSNGRWIYGMTPGWIFDFPQRLCPLLDVMPLPLRVWGLNLSSRWGLRPETWQGRGAAASHRDVGEDSRLWASVQEHVKATAVGRACFGGGWWLGNLLFKVSPAEKNRCKFAEGRCGACCSLQLKIVDFCWSWEGFFSLFVKGREKTPCKRLPVLKYRFCEDDGCPQTLDERAVRHCSGCCNKQPAVNAVSKDGCGSVQVADIPGTAV